MTKKEEAIFDKMLCFVFIATLKAKKKKEAYVYWVFDDPQDYLNKEKIVDDIYTGVCVNYADLPDNDRTKLKILEDIDKAITGLDEFKMRKIAYWHFKKPKEIRKKIGHVANTNLFFYNVDSYARY